MMWVDIDLWFRANVSSSNIDTIDIIDTDDIDDTDRVITGFDNSVRSDTIYRYPFC